MNYYDGSPIALGQIIAVDVPAGIANGRIVMLGDTYDHLDIDTDFLAWVKRDAVLRPDSVVIEWVGGNPFSNTDARYAPVGNYMFTAIDEFVTRVVVPNT